MPSAKGVSRTDRIWTPSNIITLLRICLVPVFAIVLITPWPEWFSIHGMIDPKAKAWISAIVFIAISCTDWVDGYLARRRNEVTDLGKFLDPLADKILVAAALIALVELDYLPSWPALIILTREFIVSGIRMLAASKGYVIAASWYGKAKTVLQILAIVLFIVKGDAPMTESEPSALYAIAWIAMAAAIALTIISMMDYIAKASPLLFPKSGVNATNGRLQDDSTEGDTASSDAIGDCRFDALDSSELRKEILHHASQVVANASAAGLTVGTAESLTGGMISEAITSIPGSSEIMRGSCVAYAGEAKHQLLGVSADILQSAGAVSAPCAQAMSAGVACKLGVDIAVSVTGIAGPAGAEEGKPVGTVFMGVTFAGTNEAKRLQFSGSREDIRLKTTLAALEAVERAIMLSR